MATATRSIPGDMIELETELLKNNPQWLTVLRAYHKAMQELDSATPEVADEVESTGSEETADSDGRSPRHRRTARWLPRLTSLEGIDSEELSQIHGRLIAYDLLKCDLADRSSGVVYQLTPTGRSAVQEVSDEQFEAAA